MQPCRVAYAQAIRIFWLDSNVSTLLQDSGQLNTIQKIMFVTCATLSPLDNPPWQWRSSCIEWCSVAYWLEQCFQHS